jgi:predicted AlkP superfamily phosphohydrolase/phosphomutase
MRILVLGLDCAAPEVLLGDPQLFHIRRLMALGCYGRLESVIPPITVPAWMCLSTSQDPGSLGVYGFRNRTDHSYDGLRIVDARGLRQLAVWDQVAREGKRAHVVGVPPNYPPRKTSGVSIGCFLTPDPSRGDYTHPASLAEEIRALVGEYATDVKGFRTHRKDWLREQIFSMSRKQFAVLRRLIQRGEWDYLQFVDIGLDRVQHGFWQYHDPTHRDYVAGHPLDSVVRDYYRHLDEEIGSVLELLDEETAVLLVSDHGAQRLEGGFCVNEWLVREGLLVLNEYPQEVAPFERLSVDWSRTKVWSEGGYYARVFLNVRGREPDGCIAREDYERVRDDLKARLSATVDEQGRPLGTLVFKPEEVYRHVRNIAPDLIVHFGALDWRSVGSVGHGKVHVQENDTGPDGCNHAQFGAFVLAGPGCERQGEVHGAKLLDIAPTLLELGGYDGLPEMKGTSLLSGGAEGEPELVGVSADDEHLIKHRLQGLGYI